MGVSNDFCMFSTESWWEISGQWSHRWNHQYFWYCNWKTSAYAGRCGSSFCANWVIRSQRKTYSFIKMLLNGKWALDLKNTTLSWKSEMPLKFTFVPVLLLSRFSRVRLCATPWTAAHQAPPSLGFSRQEHWSGLLFPSPMHESEKWKWSRSVMSDS